MRRTQIYLDIEQAAELALQANRRGMTLSHVIREAIDDYLAGSDDESRRIARYREALDRTFGTIPRLAHGATYVGELRRRDVERARRLDEHRRT